jgi:hypothetical protein
MLLSPHQIARQIYDIKIANKSFESEVQLKYLEMIVFNTI